MRCAAAFAVTLLAIVAAPAHAQSYAVTTTSEEWTEVSDSGADRLVSPHAAERPGGEAYGPFRLLDEHRAALVDATDRATPGQFAAMLRDHPGLVIIEMVECPGTEDDIANLQLGRMIRNAGISTHVPANGSVRSGAVELFLAGRTRQIDDGAEFAVHAWRDTDGHEPDDYPANSPVNRIYLDYYGQMGLARPQAFYDMTNAVANADARWLTAQDMREWIGETNTSDVIVAAPAAKPAMAYLDLDTRFP